MRIPTAKHAIKLLCVSSDLYLKIMTSETRYMQMWNCTLTYCSRTMYCTSTSSITYIHMYEHVHTHTTGDPMKVHSQFLSHWHSFYSTHGQEFDNPNASLLEFGGGPTIYSLISACHRVGQITFADYAATNREEVQMWRNNTPECMLA